MTEWFLYDDAGPLVTIRVFEMFHDGREQGRRNSQVMSRTPRVFELMAKRRERCRILVIAVNIAQQAQQFFESGGIEATVLFQTVFRASTKLIEVPSRLCDADDRNIEMSP